MVCHGIDELEEGYIENFFDSQVPYFEAEDRDLSKSEQSILDSAVQATEENTRTGTINEQVVTIKTIQKQKDEPSIEQKDEQNK